MGAALCDPEASNAADRSNATSKDALLGLVFGIRKILQWIKK
jgi:hypothetical protein